MYYRGDVLNRFYCIYSGFDLLRR